MSVLMDAKLPTTTTLTIYATAILHTQPSLTPSDDTIVSKGRVLTRLQSTA
jgi:hypothetical protein